MTSLTNWNKDYKRHPLKLKPDPEPDTQFLDRIIAWGVALVDPIYVVILST